MDSDPSCEIFPIAALFNGNADDKPLLLPLMPRQSQFFPLPLSPDTVAKANAWNLRDPQLLGTLLYLSHSETNYDKIIIIKVVGIMRILFANEGKSIFE